MDYFTKDISFGVLWMLPKISLQEFCKHYKCKQLLENATCKMELWREFFNSLVKSSIILYALQPRINEAEYSQNNIVKWCTRDSQLIRIVSYLFIIWKITFKLLSLFGNKYSDTKFLLLSICCFWQYDSR